MKKNIYELGVPGWAQGSIIEHTDFDAPPQDLTESVTPISFAEISALQKVSKGRSGPLSRKHPNLVFCDKQGGRFFLISHVPPKRLKEARKEGMHVDVNGWVREVFKDSSDLPQGPVRVFSKVTDASSVRMESSTSEAAVA